MATNFKLFFPVILVHCSFFASVLANQAHARESLIFKHSINSRLGKDEIDQPYMDRFPATKGGHRYCGTSTRRPKRIDEFNFPQYAEDVYEKSGHRRAQRDATTGSAVYFTVHSDALQYQPSREQTPRGSLHFPRQEFSVALWVKPAGGQRNPAVIIGLLDTCRGSGNHWTWSLGINTVQDRPGQDARFFFSVITDRSNVASSVRGTSRYEAETWVHLAASYDGSRLTLYINGAKEATGKSDVGPMFSEVMNQCKQLMIGGSINDDNGFRGAVDQVTIWSKARPHRELKDSISSPPSSLMQSDVIIQEDFEGDWLNWKTAADNEPMVIASDIPSPGELYHLVAKIPSCGVTVCDSPIVARSYISQSELRLNKTIRYRAITMAENDGSNPIIDHESILRKHAMVTEAFKSHNISWELTEFVVRNTSLRHRVVLAQCNLRDIGDGFCDEDCCYDVTGHDAGDCAKRKHNETCLDEQIGNGVCESVCNTGNNEYDGGDCCDPNISDVTVTCFDPRSLNRNYLTQGELKGTIAMESESEYESHLNVYFVNFADSNIEGVATLPWEMGVHGLFGGTVLQADRCGSEASSETIIHELGHNLGLWHVHQSMECTDECQENTASSLLGDLVQDTNPTPLNEFCRDPRSCDSDTCFDHIEFKETPYRNYMSYTDADCTDHFTEQQGSRMHCYIDLICQAWLLRNRTTSPIGIPLSPRVVSERPQSTTLSWLPPLSRYGDSFQEGACLGCSEGGRLMQYANVAQFYPTGSLSSPDKATGPPDAGLKCEYSDSAWVASSRNIYCDDCYLELVFQAAVAPSELILWANYGTDGGVRNLELKYKDGSVESMGPIQILCDMPYTLRLTHISRKVQAIRVYIGRTYFSLDAVQLVSVADWSGCENCPAMNYKILRDPPFEDGEASKVTQSTVFTDKDVADDVTYSYRIQAYRGDENGVLTSPLRHRHGQEFCGNGRRERLNNEECDDGNTLDGDGCTLNCKVEDSYVCKGESSICSRITTHDVSTSTVNQSPTDAYHHNTGFDDQWVESAVANPLHQIKETKGPVSALIGAPSTTKCGKGVDTGHGWYPESVENDTNYWVRVRFNKPVVATAVIIHLSGDGIVYSWDDPTRLSMEFMGPDGLIHGKPFTDRPVSCKDSPVHFSVSHDLNAPFAHTQEVLIHLSSNTIAISGVQLRSRASLDPVTIASCLPGQLFNPATGQCVSYRCTWPECEALTIPHALVNCSGQRDGDVCRVRCMEGYSKDGMQIDAEMLCMDGEWHGQEMICKAVDCGDPLLPYAEIVCPMGTTYGKQCKLKCIPPAKMQGTIQTLTCMADGLYSLPESFCQLQCDVPYVPNAMLISQQCQMGSHNIGTICKFRCDAGYHVRGQPSKRRKPQKLKYKCTEDTTWSGPMCEPVVCRSPPMIFKEFYTCTDGFNYNSECHPRCDVVTGDAHQEEGNTIRCIQDTRDSSRGMWDAEFTLCSSLEGLCDPPQPHSNTDVEIRCDSGYAVGSQCIVICPDKYGLSDNEPALLAANSTTHYVPYSDWNQANYIIFCTAQREWHPDPMRITCVEGCFKSDIGNGICQHVNNRAYCKWDGGDCCASTTSNGEVITTTDDSDTVDSRCFDPNAEENHPTNGSNRKNRPL